MRKNKMKKYPLYKKTINKDKEGIPIISYHLQENSLEAEIWPASGKVQAEMYGLRLAYMMNMITDLKNEVNEDMAIDVLGSGHADHKVVSKKKYATHIIYELERILP